MPICPACATENPEEALFCNACGAPLTEEKRQPTPFVQRDPTPPRMPQAPYPPYASRPPKDRSIALILEILPGLFGFLGIGWIYAGNTSAGIIWLIGFLVWTAIATIISIVTAGIGVICWLPISIACIVMSVINLNKYASQHPELFG